MNVTWDSGLDFSSLRSAERDLTITIDGNYYAYHDLRANTKLNAGLGIGTTLFVCVVLATAAVFFS